MAPEEVALAAAPAAREEDAAATLAATGGLTAQHKYNIIYILLKLSKNHYFDWRCSLGNITYHLLHIAY